jgi:hypothetical protein
LPSSQELFLEIKKVMKKRFDLAGPTARRGVVVFIVLKERLQQFPLFYT